MYVDYLPPVISTLMFYMNQSTTLSFFKTANVLFAQGHVDVGEYLTKGLDLGLAVALFFVLMKFVQRQQNSDKQQIIGLMKDRDKWVEKYEILLDEMKKEIHHESEILSELQNTRQNTAT